MMHLLHVIIVFQDVYHLLERLEVVFVFRCRFHRRNEFNIGIHDLVAGIDDGAVHIRIALR